MCEYGIIFLQEEIRNEYEKQEMPKYLNYLENISKQNKTGKKWFINDKVCVWEQLVLCYSQRDVELIV